MTRAPLNLIGNSYDKWIATVPRERIWDATPEEQAQYWADRRAEVEAAQARSRGRKAA
jgi:hypothetical protein